MATIDRDAAPAGRDDEVEDVRDPIVDGAPPVWIDDLRRALQAAKCGQEVDAIERRLDAIQAELRAEWGAASES